MTIKQVLADSIKILKNKKIPSPHLDAEILLSHSLKKPREYILTHREKKLTETQISNIQYLISRRAKNEPVAYITKHKNFYGLDFIVNKNVLIPRPETELMVDEALKLITSNLKPVAFIDVGTGSGCVIISIVKNLLEFHISHFTFQAVDISKPALNVARRNSKLHKVDKKITFYKGNLLIPILKKSNIPACNASLQAGRQYPISNIIILANLPYLTPNQIKQSPSIQSEPKLALAAGPDGLKYYRKLFKQIKLLHVSCYVLCEADPSQTKKIRQIIKKEFKKATIQIKKDLRGLDRLIIIKITRTQDANSK